ncbi:MAG: GtrA family protein [Draconibacterium sp.]|nr:GtrA family protein [Draconibacterium sp.]
MIHHFISKEFAAFLVAGGIAAIANFISRIIFNNWLSFSTSILLAYLVGMVTAFILTKLFVFKNAQSSIYRSAYYFTLVNLAAILQTWLISMGLAYFVLPWLGVSRFVPEIAHAIGIGVPVISSYLGHKFITFR